MMKCPACYNELTAVRVGNVTVDVCRGGCGGIWLDAFELQKLGEQRETAGEPLLHLRREKHAAVDPLRKRECPRCAGVKLHRHFFSAKRRVEVDQCPNCAGYWLDAGELEAIRAEKNNAAQLAQAQRSVTSVEVLRYLYQLSAANREDPAGRPGMAE